MTTETAASRFHERSIVGIGASVAAASVIGLVCAALNAPELVQGTVTAGAAGLPAAIEYGIQSRRRDTREDMARIQQGELRRPIGLVVAMFAAALFLVDVTFSAAAAPFIVNGIERSDRIDGTIIMLGIFGWFFVGGSAFVISSYASHYLGKKPYLWTAVSVGCAFVFRALLVLVALGVLIPELFALFVIYLWYLGACLAGTWYSRRHHAKFLEKKLVRMQRKASPAAAASTDPPPSNATALQEPPQASSPDLLEQLKKLGDLRDAGVLTEEEFQAKKAQILPQI